MEEVVITKTEEPVITETEEPIVTKTEEPELTKSEELVIKTEEPNQSDHVPITQNEVGNSIILPENLELQITPIQPKTTYTNIQRYNVLLRCYLDAHPHLPRQMQYAEAQQVWRSVRMDPEGAYMEVLRSLHGMAFLAQNASGNSGSEHMQDIHPLVLQAIDPTWQGVMPKPSPPKMTPKPVTPKPVTPKPIAKPQTSIPKVGASYTRISRPRGRPPTNRVQIAYKPGKRRGRPPKPKPPVVLPIIKRRPGRPRKNSVVDPAMHLVQMPIQEVISTPEIPTSTDTSLITSDSSFIQTTTLKTPSSLIITPVLCSPAQPHSNIPESAEQIQAISASPDLNASVPAAGNNEVPFLEQWEQQPGISFVQGNGLKMILSRVNNGQPLPEFRRRRRRKKSALPKSAASNGHGPMDTSNPVTAKSALSPAQGQAVDSTVDDSTPFETSSDQSFAAAILQYLLDLSELLGSATSFVVSQEMEQIQNNDPVSVYSGWIVGEQNIGPKLAATAKLPSRMNEVDCLNQLIRNEDFREVVRTCYGRVKPVAILILEGRKPGDLVRLLDNAIRSFKDWNLDSLILASQPAAGEHVNPSSGDSVDGSAFRSNGCDSSQDQKARNKSLEIEQWKNRHLRTSQYCLQIAKCADQTCCPEWRTPLRKVLPPQGFLPPPVPFAKGEQGPMAPRFEEKDMAVYGRLCERLVMESLVPRTAFQELPFDFYCPSARNELSRRVCFDCGHYFCTHALRKLHTQLMHTK